MDTKIPITDPLEKRVALIDNETDHGATKRVKIAISKCASELLVIFKEHQVDTGRAIACLDELQKAKNIGIDALNLPILEKFEFFN